MLYVISNQEGQVKIGWSKHPEKRLKQLQTGSGHKLKLIKTFDVDKLYENRLHYLLRQFRARSKGEWFALSPDSALSFIDEVIT